GAAGRLHDAVEGGERGDDELSHLDPSGLGCATRPDPDGGANSYVAAGGTPGGGGATAAPPPMGKLSLGQPARVSAWARNPPPRRRPAAGRSAPFGGGRTRHRGRH